MIRRIPFITFLLLLLSGSYAHSQADSILMLDAVRVESYQISGSLRSIPGSLSVLTGEAIGHTDGTNMAGTLNTLPGVTMQTGSFTTNRIVIRGMGSRTPYNTNRIRTYLNDIPLTSSEGISSPEEIDLQSLGRIEIVKGPSSALYGSGLGGTINLLTPVTLQRILRAGIQYGNFNTVQAGITGNLINDKSDFFGHIGYLHSDGYRENSRYDRISLLSAAGWKFTGWTLNYSLLLMGVNAGIPSSLGATMFENDPQAAAPAWKNIEGYKRYGKGMAGITLTKSFKDRLTNKLILFGRGIDSYEKRPFNNLDDMSLGAGVRNKLSYHGQKTDWVLGVEWIFEQYSWKLDLDGSLLNQNREKRSQLNIFAMGYYRPSRKLNISVAGAINRITYRLTDLYADNGDQSDTRAFPVIFSPRVGFNYAPVANWAIYGSAGHGFSMPSPEETLLPAGDVNQDIKPEQGFQFEIGTRLSLLDRALEFDGTLYWIELKDLLVTKRVTEDIFTGINAGQTRHLGMEMQLHYCILNLADFPGEIHAGFSYTFTLNRFIEFTDDTSTYNGNFLPGIPDQTLYFQLAWEPVKWLEFSFNLRYTGDQYLLDDNSLEYPGYWVSNLKLTARLPLKRSGEFNLFAGINNLVDQHHASMLVVNARGFGGAEPRYYYPGLPRNGYAGIRFSF
jgi:iron complex outermembrane receptor protein